MKQNRWQEIWNRKGDPIKTSLTLENLIRVDGFDCGAGTFPVESWLGNVGRVKKWLHLEPGKKVLEIGCGSGAFLYPLQGKEIDLNGIDYSANMIKLADQAIPEGNFKVSEAADISHEESRFDAIIVNSVFQYFPDISYAKKVFSEISRVLKGNGRVVLLDINDTEKKNDSERLRRAQLGAAEYDKLYRELSHAFYSRAWIQESAAEFGFDCNIRQVNVSGYGNSRFRFNAFLKR